MRSVTEEEIEVLKSKGFKIFISSDRVPEKCILKVDHEDERDYLPSDNGYGIGKFVDGVWEIYHINYLYNHGVLKYLKY